jgi:CheY-like chemotaxis protein/ribonuclease BN (tRNA processing enzyme)
VEVRAADGTLVVLDCGTGAFALGRELIASRDPQHGGHLLIGHTHWDHIQGFPFFEPLFVPDSRWEIYSAGGGERELAEVLAGQMTYEYSPITLEALDAQVKIHNLREGTFDVGGIRVTAQYLNHPALTLGFRLEVDGASLVYATDHEPHSLHPLDAPPGTAPVHHEDRRHIRFLEGADLVIHDAQYLLDEFPAKAGWGHSPVERVVDYCVLAGARRLALTHHDPARDDEAVDRVCQLARARVPADSGLEVFGAMEGQALELSGDAARERPPVTEATSALLRSGRPRHTVLIVDDDPDMVALLETTLTSEGVRVLTAGDGESALQVARSEHPSLVLLDRNLPGRDGLDICRTLRTETDPRVGEVPILMLTGQKLKETDLIEAFVAGATDYLTKPIKPTLVRSRVRGWLMRTV